ncbi:MAG: S9 family peptidase [Acidobacteria bacterium]|nr:MAG: S9 family peptidase [Acidobacteriota bacterium]
MQKTVVRLFVLLLVFTFAASAQKRNITEKDLFDFAWIGDPQVSPDGSTVVFVKVTVNAAKSNYDTSLWSVSTSGSDEPRKLTSGTRDSNPRWSPDGKFVAFVRSSETSGSFSQIYLLPMTGGEAFQLTNVARGAGGPVWSPDGKWIAFGSNTNPEDISKQGKPATPGERESDVRVITRAVYRADGGGYLDATRPTHLWVIRVARGPEEKPSPKQLTSGQFSEDNFVWAKDGSKIYFATDRDPEPYYSTSKTEIYSVPAGGGESALLTKLDTDVGTLSLSPDGKRFAFNASVNFNPVKSYTQTDLWIMDVAENAKPKNLTATFDFDIGAGLTGDQAAPRAGGGSPPVWTADGRAIISRYAKEGRANLASFDVESGNFAEITKGDQAVMNFRTTTDGSKLVYSISTPTRITDLYISDRTGSNAKQLTRINDALFSKLNLTEPEEIWFTSFDGKRVHTLVQKPPDFDPKKKYPLILNIHGGPHAAYGYIFDHEFQWMAAKGYVVVYPNPRGSTTYGQEFGNIIQHNYPGDDHQDLMFAVDEVIKRGYIDEKKLGITGGSGGGVLTDWAVTKTNRFAAAVSQRDISNWAAWWYSADFTQFQPSWFKGSPSEDIEGFRNRSVITFVDKIKTPMMFILGEADYRTPPGAGGEQLFRELKYRKVPTVMVRFPNEGHDLSRTGQPWHRIERLQHIVGWFDKWLMGVSKPEYAVAVDDK